VLSRAGNIEIIAEISQALGTFGMIGGQVVDLESEGKPVDKETVEYIHNNKTAAFIRASVRCGCMLAHASMETVERLSSYGNHVGLAFQVIDDILDEESSVEVMGKMAGSDRKKGKATFPSVVGMDESKRYAKELIERAHADIAFLADKGAILRELADYIRTRMF
ncbi:MAG: polyprenyl synthetase family protein, partial [Chitinivibrionales bacterium]|nr:polyprenyl synthetase family protein [Chitinivibrionales bacterium]